MLYLGRGHTATFGGPRWSAGRRSTQCPQPGRHPEQGPPCSPKPHLTASLQPPSQALDLKRWLRVCFSLGRSS